MKFEARKTDFGLGIWKVTITEESWKIFLDNGKKTLLKNLEVQGFRKGKVPAMIAESRINQSMILNEASRMALKKGYRFALEQKSNIKPISKINPEIKEVNLKQCVVEFSFDIQPEVNIKNYKGIIGIEKNETKVTDADIKSELKKAQDQFTILENKKGKAELNDQVIIDFIGRIDGKEFAGGKADNYALDLGSNSFINGFEEALVGMKINDKKEINLNFPKDYHVEELQGKPVVFDVKIKEIKKKNIPALNDDLVEDLHISGIKTLKEYKDFIKDQLLIKFQNEEKSRFLELLLDKIAKDSKIVVPNSIIVSQRKKLFKEFEAQVKSQNLTISDYCKKTGLNINDINVELDRDAKRSIEQYYILEHIKNVEKINVLDNEIEQYYEKLAKRFSLQPNDEKLKHYFPKERVVNEIEREKIKEFLYKNN